MFYLIRNKLKSIKQKLNFFNKNDLKVLGHDTKTQTTDRVKQYVFPQKMGELDGPKLFVLLSKGMFPPVVCIRQRQQESVVRVFYRTVKRTKQIVRIF